jgi:hypothetical protein
LHFDKKTILYSIEKNRILYIYYRLMENTNTPNPLSHNEALYNSLSNRSQIGRDTIMDMMPEDKKAVADMEFFPTMMEQTVLHGYADWKAVLSTDLSTLQTPNVPHRGDESTQQCSLLHGTAKQVTNEVRNLSKKTLFLLTKPHTIYNAPALLAQFNTEITNYATDLEIYNKRAESQIQSTSLVSSIKLQV